MTAHVSTELLSAYLDQELAVEKARQLEAHLESCSDCHSRLQGMRRVVSNLRHLDRMAPSSTLDQLVMRRIALADEPKGWLDRLESSLPSYQRQSSMLALFSVVIALALIVFLFLYALQIRQNGSIEVRFDDPAWESGTQPQAGSQTEGSQLTAGGLSFELHDGRWIEKGLDPSIEARKVGRGSEDAADLAARHPEIEPLVDIEEPIVFEVDGEVIELR